MELSEWNWEFIKKDLPYILLIGILLIGMIYYWNISDEIQSHTINQCKAHIKKYCGCAMKDLSNPYPEFNITNIGGNQNEPIP